MNGDWRRARPIVRDKAKAPARAWPTAEALEVMVQRAWCALPRAGDVGAPATVYLGPNGVTVGGPVLQGGRGVIVGRYDRRVHLGEFRDDVFAEYEKSIGRGS
jgi:hypothetical protein